MTLVTRSLRYALLFCLLLTSCLQHSQVRFLLVAPAAFVKPCVPVVRCSAPGAGSFHIPLD